MEQSTLSINEAIVRGDSSSLLSVDLAKLLQDRDAVRTLLENTYQRLKLFEDSLRFLRSMNRDSTSRVRVLVDWDVLREYIEIDDITQDQQSAIKFFFEKGTTPYSLPLGAFQELFNYLSRKLGSSSTSYKEENAVREENAVPRLAGILGVAPEKLRDPAWRDQLERELGWRTARISKVIKVLINPRFGTQVEATATDSERSLCLSLITNQKRRDPVNRPNRGPLARDQRDSRDAMNLAVTLHRSKLLESEESANQPDLEQFILLTRTGAIIRAAKMIQGSQWRWLAVHPNNLLIPELLGGLNDKRNMSILKARIVRNYLRDLHDILDNQDMLPSLPEYAPARHADEIKFGRLLNQLAEVTKLLGKEIHAIEKVRLSIESVQIAHHRQSPREREDADGSDVAEIAINYLKLLDLLASHLKDIHLGVTYTEAEIPRRAGYKEFQIARAIGGNGEGAIVLRSFEDAAVPETSYFTAHWEIVCSEDHLIKCLEEWSKTKMPLWSRDIAQENCLSTGVELDPPTDSSVWNEGIVISTAYSTYGLSPAVALKHGEMWRVLQPHRLRRIVERAHSQTPSREMPRTKRVKPAAAPVLVGGLDSKDRAREEQEEQQIRVEIATILEIRINAPWCDIVYEIVPPEQRLYRRLTVLSNRKIGPFLAFLYDWLGLELVSRQSLQATLEKLLPTTLREPDLRSERT